MRIVYTNLSENDAGVKRSVRQLQVEFNGTGARPADGAVSARALAAMDERNDAQRLERAQAPEAPDALCRQPATQPLDGMGGLRSIFIKKFVDTSVLLAGRKGNVSIIV